MIEFLIIIFLLIASSSFYCLRISDNSKAHKIILSRKPLFDMQILIHGTRNAFTTLRNYDVVFFKFELDNIRLGVYTNDGNILPLCSYNENSNEFHIDPYESALPAIKLKNENRILRIVSSDRRGESTFTIDEYLGSDVVIPLRNKFESHKAKDLDLNSQISVPTEIINSSNEKVVVENELQTLQLEIMQLQLKVLKLQERKLSEGVPNSVLPPVRLSVYTSDAPKPVGPYTQAIVSNGIVYTSGSIGLDPFTNQLVQGGIEVEARRAFTNLQAVLQASGSDLRNVLKLTILLQDLQDFSTVNNICRELWPNENYPARTTFQVAALPLGAQIEVEAIATTTTTTTTTTTITTS